MNISLRDARDAIFSKRSKSKTEEREMIAEKDEANFLESVKEINIENVISKIAKINCLSCIRCELSEEDKFSIIEHISEKENVSYNPNTLSALINVWKCPAQTYYEISPAKEKVMQGRMDSIFDQKNLKNFFLLQGQVSIFRRELVEKSSLSNEIEEKQHESTFETQNQLECLSSLVDKLEANIVLYEGNFWGPLFRKEDLHDKSFIMKVCNAIIVEVREPELKNTLINLGGLQHEKKLKIIEAFPIFSSVNKKIQSILSFMQLKKYSKNECIYKMKQQPQRVYLILNGEVVFEVKASITQSKKLLSSIKSGQNEYIIHTETLGVGSYFGEEEVLYRQGRTLTSVCTSADCDLLEIPAEKFEKLLTKSDFYEDVKRSADMKIGKRKEKIEKALKIYSQFNDHPEEFFEDSGINAKRDTLTAGEMRKSVEKTKEQQIKIMHGNIIRTIPKAYRQKNVNFSMLKINPDMFSSTMKKFRKHTMKQPEKYKPHLNWSLKRVWKVLNLEDILREGTDEINPEGIKFFETSRRLRNHVQENKSMRPKISGCSYKTKLEYVAYLQQFNN